MLATLDARWDGPGRSFIRGCSRFGGWTWWCGPAFRRYRGATWVDLAVCAGRPVTDTSSRVLFARCWALGRLGYPAGWRRWVSAVWRRPAPGVRTAWASARRDPART